MRKPQEDPIARTVVENAVSGYIDEPGIDAPHRLAKKVTAEFPHVQFEKVTKTVLGEDVHLRRPVLTGQWEVDPNATGAGK